MGRRRTTIRAVALIQAIDTVFIVLTLFSLAFIFSVEVEAILWPWLGGSALRVGVSLSYLIALIQPLERCMAAGERPSEELLLAATAHSNRLPGAFPRVYGLGWLLAGSGVLLWMRFIASEGAIGPGELIPGLLYMLGGCAASVASTGPTIRKLFEREREWLAERWAERGRAPPLHPIPLAKNLSAFTYTIVFAVLGLLAVPAWTTHAEAQRELAVGLLAEQLDEELERLEQGLEPLAASVVEPGALLTPGRGGKQELRLGARHRVAVDRRARVASVAAPLDEGRWLELRGSCALERGLPAQFALFTLIVLTWVPFALGVTVSLLINPLRALDDQMRAFVESGRLAEIEQVSVERDDEIGTLTRNFNAFIAGQRELAALAHRVAEGELDIQLSHTGEISEAFETMVEQLRAIVTQIRATTLEVGSVSAELLATSRQQQELAERSTSSVADIERVIHDFIRAAEHIAASSTAVLDNAERTTVAADTTLDKIGELSGEAGGVSEMLDEIRGIADRSDLLALNGSLEATRAGEAGRGFGLVAAEMRRLAERVTRTVSDGRERVARIEASGAATLEVTDASRSLTAETVTAAREIVLLTHQQRDQTEGVSASVALMGEAVTASAAATVQVGASVENLRERVRELERLTERFELGKPR